MRRYFIGGIGVAAFVIGGLIARAKALDGIEIIETKYLGKEPEPKDEIVLGEVVETMEA
jgi:hypothetical protein